MRIPGFSAAGTAVVLLLVPGHAPISTGARDAPASTAPGADPQATVPGRDQEITVAELGRLLFWDPILSGERDVACATCHHPDFAYADGRALSLGVGAVGIGPERRDTSNGRIPIVKRNSPTVLNVAFNGAGRRGRRDRDRDGGRDRDRDGERDRLGDGALPEVGGDRSPMFWDRRVRGLEAQALEPLKALDEMRGMAYSEAVAVDSVVARLRSIPEYARLFRAAFGAAPIDSAQLASAIASFERSLSGMNSPFDRFRAGDETALTEQQRRGRRAFDDAGCDRCHEGVMFSDFDLFAEGVPEHPLLAQPDTGDGRFRFRTPTLRNVALTAPYMHNGTLPTLEEVLRFYDEGRSRNPNVADARSRRRDRDEENDERRIPRVYRRFRAVDDMSESEMQDIIAFLHALTDSDFDRIVPARVPSGLPPGGRIDASGSAPGPSP